MRETDLSWKKNETVIAFDMLIAFDIEIAMLVDMTAGITTASGYQYHIMAWAGTTWRVLKGTASNAE